MIDHYEPKIDLTLLGCGFLGSYHVGAICLLEQIWPKKPYNRICGASCGGLLGALVVSGIRLETVLGAAMSIMLIIRQFVRQPHKIVSICELVERKVDKLLPSNAHELCNDRLGISVTKLWPLENVLATRFESRNDLIAAICAGCFIPLWSGSLVGPKFRGQLHLDGAYTNNMPKFEPEPGLIQLTVGPFAGEVDISPKDEQNWGEAFVMGTRFVFNWPNLVRCGHAMLPWPLDTYRRYLLEGHSHMKEYILRENLIKCRKCHIDQTNQEAQSNSATSSISRPTATACIACLKLFEQVDSLKVPSTLLDQCSES